MNIFKMLVCCIVFSGMVNAAEPVTSPPATGTPELININTADIVTLATLTGITPKKAKDIIEYRQANKGFKTVDELTNIHGIGKKTLETNRARLTVGDVKTLAKPLDSKEIVKPIDSKPSAPSTANGLMPKM